MSNAAKVIQPAASIVAVETSPNGHLSGLAERVAEFVGSFPEFGFPRGPQLRARRVKSSFPFTSGYSKSREAFTNIGPALSALARTVLGFPIFGGKQTDHVLWFGRTNVSINPARNKPAAEIAKGMDRPTCWSRNQPPR